MSKKDLERKINKTYEQARGDIGRKWYAYFERGEKRLAKKEADLQAAKDAGNKAEIRRLEEELRRDKQNFTTGNEYYRDMVEETTRQMAEANQTALAYVNGELPSYYMQAYNTEMRAESVDLGFRYDLADEATVRKLIKDGDIELPNKKVDIPKDQRWNTKQINANVTQGIIQGESIAKIAKRLEPIMDNNRKAAMRNAVTLVGSAQNAGRMDRYKDLSKQGAVMKKIWIATGDNRTRDWHLEMDGQARDINEPFVDGNGNELMFPKDPKAAPETVYNCRCSMKSKIVGFINQNTGEIIMVDYEAGTARHKAEIQAETDRRKQEKAEKAAKKAQRAAKTAQNGKSSQQPNKNIPDYKSGSKPQFLKNIEQAGIEYRAVGFNDRELTFEEIVAKLGGGDMTQGSCSSLCYGYAANRAGYDVIDFRGGDSRAYFARRANSMANWQGIGATVDTATSTSDIKAATELLGRMETGKEYILGTGAHAAIVRKTATGYEYLELQSATDNGWHTLDKDKLRYRFGCKQSHSTYGMKYEVTSYSVDIETVQQSREAQEMFGYINTAPEKQKKSARGTIK